MKEKEVVDKSIKLRDYLWAAAERFGKENDIPEHVQIATFVAIGKQIERRLYEVEDAKINKRTIRMVD